MVLALGLASLPALAAKQYPLNVITAMAQTDPMYAGLVRFQELLQQSTQGQIPVRIFYGSQLGSDDDILEQARAGANVAVLVDGGRLSVYHEAFGLLNAPYLVDGLEEARELVTSPLFNTWVEQLAGKVDLRVLSFNWWQGERHVLAMHPVREPRDLAGVRMRTIGAPVYIETVRALGAVPTPISWAEVYPALQQRVIDAAEAQHPGTFGARLYEVVSHISKTGHINLLTGLVAGDGWFQRLPAELQTKVLAAAHAAGDYASDNVRSQLEYYEAEMRATGVTILEVDTAPFKAASLPVYQRLGLEELRRQVERSLDEEQP